MKSVTIFLIIISIASGCAKPNKVDSDAAPAFQHITELPDGSMGWTIYWADGPVCVGNDSSQYVLMDGDGYIKFSTESSHSGVPLSMYVHERKMLSEFPPTSKTNSHCLGVLDIKTQDIESIFPCKTAVWLHLPYYYDRGKLSNQNEDTILALSYARRRASDTIFLHHRQKKNTEQIQVPEGKIRSWAWTEDSKHPILLTVSPGFLYETGERVRAICRISSLDSCSSAMLSPKCDRLIGFEVTQGSAFYVDLDRPEERKKIRSNDGNHLEKWTVKWAIWSPSGTYVALVIQKQVSSDLELYIGDPELSLHRVDRNGLRFVSSGENPYQPLGPTVVWNQDETRLFCIMEEDKNDSQNNKYILARLDLSMEKR